MAPVTVTEVTDPFCTWCWGWEPVRRRVDETYREQVEFDFAMAGLVEDFETFRDAANDIADPSDVAAHWEEASESHGMPVDPAVWRGDPPRSTHPANVAYEAAELLDADRADRYLRRLREAIAVERRDVSRESVLVELAEEVGFDPDGFADALDSDGARAQFERDRRFIRRNRATALPTFRVAADGDATWARGFQPFDDIRDAIAQVDPNLDEYDPRPVSGFVRRCGRVATREVAEVYDVSVGHAAQILRSLEDEDRVTATDAGNGYLWEPVARRHDSDDPPREDDSRPLRPGTSRCRLDGDCTTTNR